jgi:hypothetical protein
MLPLYEGKMVHHFNHRWNSYYGTGDDDCRVARAISGMQVPLCR